MGTNYYIECKYCGNQLRHIGKQSAGWKFLSNHTKIEAFILIEQAIQDDDKVFKDEYGKELTLKEFINKVTDDWMLNETDEMDWS